LDSTHSVGVYAPLEVSLSQLSVQFICGDNCLIYPGVFNIFVSLMGSHIT